MYQPIKLGVVTEEEMEIKLVPSGQIVVAQISSGVIRGTLTIQTDIEKEELTELGAVIFNLMQELELNPMEDENDVINERGN